MIKNRMKKKSVLLSLLVLGIVAGVLVLSGQSQQAQQKEKLNRPEMPERILYRHLFRHAAEFKRKGDEAEKEGKDATNFRRFFKNKAELDNAQARALDEVAENCDREMRQLDERAKALLAGVRAQYPDGQLPAGQAPPRPPAELRQLSEERDAVVLRARDRLREVLGEGEFKRFDKFVKTRVARDVQAQTPGQAAPEAQ
jgi:cell division protein ZapA (FtsZ GTPase activity inhibitor)